MSGWSVSARVLVWSLCVPGIVSSKPCHVYRMSYRIARVTAEVGGAQLFILDSSLLTNHFLAVMKWSHHDD